MTPSTPAIACSLEAGDFKDRIAWIAALSARPLRRVRRDDVSLVLIYNLSARDDVADLVARERACCAFLSFAMRETGTTVELDIRVHDEAREAADVLLGPFLGGVPAEQGSMCCGSCPSAQSELAPLNIPDADNAQPKSGKTLGTTAAAMATVALACGVCCVAPIALPSLALGGIGAALAWFGNAHAWITAIAAILIIAGWVLVYRHAVRRKARPAASSLWVMAFASVMLTAAMAWPRLESAVARLLSSA